MLCVGGLRADVRPLQNQVIKQFPLDARTVYEVPISRDAPTTLMFPSPITGLEGGDAREATVTTKGENGEKTFKVDVMLLTPKERAFYKHGGILQYTLRDLAAKAA